MHPHQSSGRPLRNRQRDPLFVLLTINGIAGALLGILFVAGAIWLDIGHLRRLVGFTTDGVIAVALLTAGSIITFGSVVMGGAIMMLGRKERNGEDDKDRGIAIPATAALATAAVRRQPARHRGP